MHQSEASILKITLINRQSWLCQFRGDCTLLWLRAAIWVLLYTQWMGTGVNAGWIGILFWCCELRDPQSTKRRYHWRSTLMGFYSDWRWFWCLLLLETRLYLRASLVVDCHLFLRWFKLLRLIQEIPVWARAVVDCCFGFLVSGESVVSCWLKQGIISFRVLWWILIFFFASRVTPVSLLFQPLVDGWFNFWLRVSRASPIGRNKALSLRESCGGLPFVFRRFESHWLDQETPVWARAVVDCWLGFFCFWWVGRLLFAETKRRYLCASESGHSGQFAVQAHP